MALNRKITYHSGVISRLTIRHFRSIREIDIALSPLNAFIGRNNAGKSNVMRALNLVLGDVYPSVRAFDEKDFFDYDKSKPIQIEAHFDKPLICDARVCGFRLAYNGIEVDYVALNASGATLTYSPGGREIRVSNEMRDEVAMMYLGLERQASQQVRAASWTLYGKLLRYIEKQISTTKKSDYRTSIESTYNTYIQPELAVVEDLLRKHVKRQTGLDLNLRLAVLDPIEIIKDLRPYLKSASGREFDAEDMGAGTQSALAIAIARAYAHLVRRPLLLAIEEPELYLHPHGCRHFRNLLNELSNEGVQVLFTTHERSFVDLRQFRSIHLVRKDGPETSIFSGIRIPQPQSNNFNVISKFDEEVNEVFFANQVILVEGACDRIAAQIALEKLGVGLDQQSISIAECGGLGDMKAIAQTLMGFAIPIYCLVDEDPGNPITAKALKELEEIIGPESIFIQRPKLEALFSLPKKPSKVDAMTFFPNWFLSNTAPDVYTQLQDKLTKHGSFQVV